MRGRWDTYADFFQILLFLDLEGGVVLLPFLDPLGAVLDAVGGRHQNVRARIEAGRNFFLEELPSETTNHSISNPSGLIEL